MKVKCLALAAAMAGLSSVAQAMPVAPLGTTSLDSPSAVIHVAGGCGRGWHYTRAHGCMPPRVDRQHTYKPSYRMWHHLKRPY